MNRTLFLRAISLIYDLPNSRSTRLHTSDKWQEHWREVEARLKAAVDDIPTIVCLCGSTRFLRLFQKANLTETMRGRIVLSIGAATGTDDDHFGNLPKEQYDALKARLDALHLKKIEMADVVVILNENDYIGESTTRELLHARSHGKTIEWLEYPSVHSLEGEYQWSGFQPSGISIQEVSK